MPGRDPQSVTEPPVHVGADDPRVADYRNLTDVGWRTVMEPEQGLFLAEGSKVILRALAAGYRPRSALTTEKWLPELLEPLTVAGAEVLVADESVLREVVGFRLHRGALAAFERAPDRSMAEVVSQTSELVVLEDLVDHTNVGLVMRSAAALGIGGALISPRCADPYYRRSIKTSMAAALTLPWARADPWPQALSTLVDGGFEVLGLTPDPSAENIRTWRRPPEGKVALLLGTEGDGLSPDALAAVDTWLRIPMAGSIDSLNVAAAAAIACYAVTA